MDGMDIDSDGINLAAWESDAHEPGGPKYIAALKKKRAGKHKKHRGRHTTPWVEYVRYKGSIEAAVEGKRSGEWNRFLSSGLIGRLAEADAKHARLNREEKPTESIWDKLSILTGIPTIIVISIISATAVILQMETVWYMKMIYSIFPAIMIYVALKGVSEARI